MSAVAGHSGGRAALVLTVGGLTAYNLVRSLAIPEWAQVPANMAAGGAVLLGAIAAGESWEELGLSRDRLGAGARYGTAVFVLVVGVLVLVAVLPFSSGFLADDRVSVGTGSMLFRVLVGIPLGTVVLEELAFRGSLLGQLRRRMSTRRAVLLSSALFGLWHVAPALTSAHANATLSGLATSATGLAATVTGTVVVTTAAGAGLCWLRLRSGSLLAPAMAHYATNALAFLAAWIVNR